MNKRNTSKENKKDRKEYPYKVGGKNRTKKITLLLFVMLSVVLLIGTVSALEVSTWDNILNYKNNDLTVDIINTLGFSKLGTLELKSHNSIDEVLHFGFGKEEVVIYYDFTDWELYPDGLGEVYFTDENTGEEIVKDYYFVEWKEVDVEYNDYKKECSLLPNGENVCENVVIGTHIEKEFKWVRLDNKDIENKRIGIKTYVNDGDYIDAVWTIAGKKIKKHSSWDAGLSVNLQAYWNFDENTGTTITDVTGNGYDGVGNNASAWISGGILGNAWQCDGVNDFVYFGTSATDGYDDFNGFGNEFSISFWTNDKAYGNSLYVSKSNNHPQGAWSIRDAASVGGAYVYMNQDPTFVIRNSVSSVMDGHVIGEWYFVVYTYSKSNTNVTLYGNATILATDTKNIDNTAGADSAIKICRIQTTYRKTAIDEMGYWSRALSYAEVTQLYNEGVGITLVPADDSPTVTLNNPIDTANLTINSISFEGVVIDDFNLINVSLIINNIYNETNTSGINNANYTFLRNFGDGNNNWTYEACDNASQCTNGTVRTFSIDTTFPIVNISSPNETSYNYLFYGNNFTLNTTINDTNLDTCWYDYNATNTTFSCSSGVLTSQNLTLTNYTTIIIYANDSAGHLSYDSFSWTYNLFDFNEYTSENNITESTTATISGKFQTGSSLSSSYLEYNNTNHSISINSLGGNRYILTTSLTTPSVSANTNITWFFWVNNVNATSYNQTVININLDDCSTYTFYLVNYTLVEELTQENIVNVNSTIESLVIIKTITGGEIAQFNQTFNGTATASICSKENLNTSGLRLWEQSRYGSTDHVFEQHNIQNASMISLPNEITLRDLISTSATTFRIQYKSSTFLPVENAVINIQRKYIGEGIFKTIESPLTDSSGESSASLDLNSVLYRIIVSKNGETLATFENPAIACDNILTGDCSITINERDSATLINNYDTENNFNYGLSQDNRTITLSFSIPSGENRLVNLFVNQSTILGNKTSCNQTLYATSGQLQCDIAEGLGDVYLVVDVSADNILIRKASTTILEDRSQYFGTDNIVLTFFLVLSLVLLMVSSPITVLIGLVIGLIASSLMLLLNSGDVFGVAPVLTYLIIIVILLIVKISGRENR